MSETHIMDIENIDDKFMKVVNSPEWKQLQEFYNSSNDIYVLGHGGNMGVADHTAVDRSVDGLVATAEDLH